jgi:UDP-glucose 4-epimerase
MSSYLVTGGAGFIGAALAVRLLAAGHEVVIIDNLSTGFRSNVPVGATFIEGDCQDTALYAALPQRPYAAIFHIAGQSSGEISFDDPVYDLQTNAQSTLLLLQFARRIGCRRMVYASTMSVYGDQPDAPVAEDAPTTPKSFYGVGKLASEHYLRIYRQYGIESVALRLFNVYGPGQNMDNLRQGMVSIYLAQALKKRLIHVKGSADRFRDFVYVDDVVDALLRFETQQLGEHHIFNIGTGVRTTVHDLVERIRASLPFAVDVRYEGNTPGDMFGIRADCRRAAIAAGWTAQVDLAAGLQRMVDWALPFCGEAA